MSGTGRSRLLRRNLRRGSQILDVPGGADVRVIGQCDPLDLCPNSDACLLDSRQVFKATVSDGDVLGQPANVDPNPVVSNHTVLDTISISAAESPPLLAEQDAHFAIVFNRTISNQILCVPMTEIDAKSDISRRYTVFCHAVGYAPAEEKALVVPLGEAVPKGRSLRSATGMKTQVGIVESFAIFKADIVTHLKAETIAIVVARGNISEFPPVAVLHEHRSAEIIVNIAAVLPIPIQNDILNFYIVNLPTAQKREEG